MATTTAATRRYQLAGHLSAPLRAVSRHRRKGRPAPRRHAGRVGAGELAVVGELYRAFGRTHRRTARDASITLSLHHWINDGLMAVFFFLIGLEIRESWRSASLTDRRSLRLRPRSPRAGGMVVPALLYLLVNPAGEAAAAGASSSAPTPRSSSARSRSSGRRV